jgi:hypothetical protein
VQETGVTAVAPLLVFLFGAFLELQEAGTRLALHKDIGGPMQQNQELRTGETEMTSAENDEKQGTRWKKANQWVPGRRPE